MTSDFMHNEFVMCINFILLPKLDFIPKPELIVSKEVSQWKR